MTQKTLSLQLPSCPLWVYKVFPFLRWWPNVNKETGRADLMSGLTGALIVLPQAVAFATIAGLPPEYGLYAAMVPAIVAALFGSSWHLVSGPTTAISIAVFASVSPYAQPGTPEFIGMVLTLTFLTGLFQLILGLARMGVLVNFISHTVVIGFTAGAAMLIAGSQIKNFFGLPIPRGTEFFKVLQLFVEQIGQINPYVTGVATLTLLCGIAVKRWLPKIPYMIAAMIVGSVVAVVLNGIYGQEVTHIKTVGALPSGLPPLSMPDFSFHALSQMTFPALIVTMLALTEAVSISRAIAAKSGQHIDGNQEFIGQGLSNLAGSFFSGYPASGSFNRSGVNYAAGARTPLAAVFASLFLVMILLLVAPLAAYLPTAAMAGILFLVAWGLIDTHHIAVLPKISWQETVVLWVTLIGTLVDLEKGIFFGIALSLALYLYRTSRPVMEPVIQDAAPDSDHFVSVEDEPECPQVKFLRLNGSIFFGAVAHLQQQMQELEESQPELKHVVIVAGGINFVDLAGAEFLAEQARHWRKRGGGLYFYRMKPSVASMLQKGGFMDDIREYNLFPVGVRPINVIYDKLDRTTCQGCASLAFPQCRAVVGQAPQKAVAQLAAETVAS